MNRSRGYLRVGVLKGLGLSGEGAHDDGVAVDLFRCGKCGSWQRRRRGPVSDCSTQLFGRIGAQYVGTEIARERSVAGADRAARNDRRRGGKPASAVVY